MTKLSAYRDRLDTEPLTLTQLGAIHGEFRRLGYRAADRTDRLRVTERLARSGPIETTRDLTMGEAGRTIRALRECYTLADIARATYRPVTFTERVLAFLFGLERPA
jgi:hypothetical protein